jgi:hypothetical protein
MSKYAQRTFLRTFYFWHRAIRAIFEHFLQALKMVKVAGQSCWSKLMAKVAGQSCQSKLPVKVASQSCRSMLLVKVAGQSCWSKLLVKVAGQSCWSKLLVKVAGQSCWPKLLVKVAERSKRLFFFDRILLIYLLFCLFLKLSGCSFAHILNFTRPTIHLL